MIHEDRGPRVLVFPPFLFAGTFALGLVLHVAVPLRITEAGASRAVTGAIALVMGAALGWWGERTMKRAGTHVRPDRPSTTIVVDGPFRFTRNPLYVAVTLIVTGLGLLLNLVWPILLLVPMWAVLHFGVVRREERYLETKFGETYRDYRSRVRRYL